MSYESEMLVKLKMPPRDEVEKVLLNSLFEHNGTIKEFVSGEEVVDEIANTFNLNDRQRNAFLETIYRKENRTKKSNLWHRLLFRAADNLAKQKLVFRPTQALKLTNRREWMLSEEGFELASEMKGISDTEKEKLSVKTFEVEKFVKKLTKKEKPRNYNPFNVRQKADTSKLVSIRARGFRKAVIETYTCRCAVCGLKIYSPTNYQWEVEAAHIVPHAHRGKDDIWNGLSLCRFHHWAFDAGWFSLDSEFCIFASAKLGDLPEDMGKAWGYDLMGQLTKEHVKIHLPENNNLWPDVTAVEWHREHVLQGQ